MKLLADVLWVILVGAVLWYMVSALAGRSGDREDDP
jgi:hypothetical protein